MQVAVVALTSMAVGLAAPAGITDQPVVTGGVEIFYGVIPAQIILGHPSTHPEREMHGGVPAAGTQDHLIVSLFDSKTRQRIVDAKVQATATGPEIPTQTKLLEPMQFTGSATYGNYFDIRSSGPVRIEVEVRRPGAAQPARAFFDYSNPRGKR